MLIAEMVKEVAFCRASEQEATDLIKQRRAKFEKSIEMLLAHQAREKAELQEKEAELRVAILLSYTEDGNKKPHPALGIRITKKLDYDPAYAEEWAHAHSPNLLMLDKKRFEKVLKAGGMPDFPATEHEKPTATIAKDLSEYLEGD